MAGGYTQRHQKPLFLRSGINGQGWACLLIYTKAVLSNGRRRDPPLDLEEIHGIVLESVSWVHGKPMLS